MFLVSKSNSVQAGKIDTVIGQDTVFTGNIISKGMIKIEGTYNGDIYTNSDVIISEFAKVKGNISANNISVSGYIEGNISCSAVLEILDTAHIKGNVESYKLTVARGAIVNGECNMMCEGRNDSFKLLEN